MDAPVRLDRKRPIKSCYECYRRKQKCNHEKPCDVCTKRGVPHLCHYSSPSSTELPRPTSPSQRSPQAEVEQDNSIAAPVSPARYYDEAGHLQSELGMQVKSLLHLPRLEKPHDFTPQASRRLKDLLRQLPPQAETQELVDVFFTHVNWYFGLLEPYYFNNMFVLWKTIVASSMGEASPEDFSCELLCFQALLFAVLAASLQFLPAETMCARTLNMHNQENRNQVSERFSEKGLEIMAILGCHQFTINGVQHELLRAFWLKNCGRGKEAWHVLSSSIRMAQDLGMHLHQEVSQDGPSDVHETLGRLWYDEFKRRLWIKLFSWDSHMAFSLGRPRIINAIDCTAKTPVDCDFPSQPSEHIPITPGYRDQPSSYTPHVLQYKISQKMHEVVLAGAHKGDFQDFNIVMGFHRQVMFLLDQLPPAMRPRNPDTSWDSRVPHLQVKRQQNIVTANSFLLALHRQHARLHDTSRDAAIQAALEILNAQQHLFKLLGNSHSKAYMLSSYSVEAGIFLSCTIAEHPVTQYDLNRQVEQAIEQAISRLTWMAPRSTLARSGVQILQLFFDHMKTSGVKPWDLNTPASLTGIHNRSGDLPHTPASLLTTTYLSNPMVEDDSQLSYPNGFVGTDLDWSDLFAGVTDCNYNMQNFLDRFS